MGERLEKIKTRAVTIIIGVPIILLIIHLDGLIFYFTIALLAILGSLELRHIFRNKDYHPSLFMGIGVTLFFLFIKTLSGSFFIDERLLFTVIILSLFMEQFLVKRNNRYIIINISITLFIAIYIGHLLSFLIDIRGLSYGKIFLIFTLFSTWMSDTVAYIVGINFGKRHIFPNLSPNKTLEGSIGGILCGAIFGMAFYSLLPLSPLILFTLGLLAAICGQTGDLFESIIKRNFDVKDSGKIIPGHGGILDCMDSILFSVPVLYFCLTYLI